MSSVENKYKKGDVVFIRADLKRYLTKGGSPPKPLPITGVSQRGSECTYTLDAGERVFTGGQLYPSDRVSALVDLLATHECHRAYAEVAERGGYYDVRYS